MRNEQQMSWFVMRDLTRPNASLPAYKLLEEKNFKVFTPMKWRLVIRHGKRMREKIPFMHDLLFVYDTRAGLDLVVEQVTTLQYRWLRNAYREPMTVADTDMERFIRAVNASESPRFYLPEEITPEMYRHQVRIVGGPLDQCEGYLLTRRGSKVKRLFIELPGLFSVGVEVNPEYIELL